MTDQPPLCVAAQKTPGLKKYTLSGKDWGYGDSRIVTHAKGNHVVKNILPIKKLYPKPMGKKCLAHPVIIEATSKDGE